MNHRIIHNVLSLLPFYQYLLSSLYSYKLLIFTVDERKGATMVKYPNSHLVSLYRCDDEEEKLL